MAVIEGGTKELEIQMAFLSIEELLLHKTSNVGR